ncbi:MAG: carbamoyl transferase [bacterium]|nr:carbamoyl transferase [bacterium]
MYILGINSVYHESSACLIKDGTIVSAIEEERINRVKHAKAATIEGAIILPYQAINFCLNSAGISMKDISHIGYSFDPDMRYKKNKDVDKDIVEDGWGSEVGENRFMVFNNHVVNLLEIYYSVELRDKFKFIPHHLCHLGSAFFVSPYKNSAILCVDGIGEFESTTYAKGIDNKIEIIGSRNYPHSLGFLWEYFSEYLGFSEYDACKVMGLASFGDPMVYLEKFHSLISYDEKGEFTINIDLIKFRLKDFSKVENLLGPKREKHDSLDECHENIAASLQYVTEQILIRIARELHSTTGFENLCIAGGVGLNCVANGKIIKETLFKNVWVQPAANDAGTSIGAAFYIWNNLLNKPRDFVMDHAYLGPEYCDNEIKDVLDCFKINYEESSNVETDTAKLIAEGNIIGWHQGRMEFGPRALGNRSLLADPRDKRMKDILNDRVKHREAFRPFCPSVMHDHAHKYFEGKHSDANKYMLATVDVLSDAIPSVTHTDGTARIQKVYPETNKRYYTLLEEFEKLTGVGVILNTSFNDQEPIVCSPSDSVKTFLKTDIDYLVIGNYIINKKDNTRKYA